MKETKFVKLHYTSKCLMLVFDPAPELTSDTNPLSVLFCSFFSSWGLSSGCSSNGVIDVNKRTFLNFFWEI